MLPQQNLYKTAAAFSTIALLSMLSGCSVSKDSNSVTYTEKNTTYCELKNFTAQYDQGKVYLNWIVNTNISNYYFVLEKTNDGTTYRVIQTIKGFPSPVSQGLLFSYIDCNLVHTSRTYRLKAVLPIKNGPELLLYTGAKNLFKDLESAMIRVDNNNTVAANK